MQAKYRRRTPPLAANAGDYRHFDSVSDGSSLAPEPERGLGHLLEQSLIGLFLLRHDGSVVYANDKMAGLLGYDSAAQLSGMSVTALVAPEDLVLLLAQQRIRLDGSVASVRYSCRFLHKDGSRRWVEVHGSVSQYQGRPVLLEWCSMSASDWNRSGSRDWPTGCLNRPVKVF